MTDRIRLRALALGFALGLVLCVVTPYNNAYLNNTPLGGGHFPLAPFFIAAWLFVISALSARLRKSPGIFNGSEILTMWVLMILVSSISYAGLAQTFFINITAPFHFAKDGFHWAEALQPVLPASWYPAADEAGKAAVDVLYNGLEGGRDMGWAEVLGNIPWSVWSGPLLTWSVFILLSFFVMICLVNLFGKQWVVNERVNFPLMRVPQLMGLAVDGNSMGGFLTDRYLLTGLCMAASLQLINGLHFHYPQVPELPTLILAGPYFPKYGLFSGFHKLKLYVYPAFIGFAFLTTRQISFSMWFFYIMGCLGTGVLYVFGLQFPESALGATFGPEFGRPEDAQVIGAYLVFFLFILWLARTHLKQQAAAAFRFGDAARGNGSDSDWKPSGWPLWGVLIGGGAMVWWCRYFGLPMAAAVLVPMAFFMVLIVASRIICQGGLPFFTLTAAPMDGLIGIFGSGFLGTTGLAASAVMQKVLFLDLRETVMPTLFHGSKVGEKVRNRGALFAMAGLVMVVAVALSFAVMLALCYRYGVRDMNMDWATTSTIAAYESAQRLIDVPVGPNFWMLVFAGAGAMIMLVLVVLYYKVHWWTLHPIGYLVAYSAGMQMLWFSFFIGWICNHLCLHYGGTRLFNRLRFLFIGLILGDFLMGGIWALTGWLTGTSFNVFPL